MGSDTATTGGRLHELAGLHGVLTEFIDSAGQLRKVEDRAIRKVLAALGSPVGEGAPGEIEAAIEARRREDADRWIEPVVVAWEGEAVVPLNIPEEGRPARLDCRLTLEDGEVSAWSVVLDGPSLTVPGTLPTGYHRLNVRRDGEAAGRDCLVIAAPERACEGPPGRAWGVFCPLYSLHRATSWGAGDFGDLDALIDWTAERGGSLVATLPMLAASFDESPWISPYSPTSRLFWNELFLDLGAIPGLARCAPAMAVLDSDAFKAEVAALQGEALVDYGRQMRLKRRVLEPLAEAAFAAGAETSESFRGFLEHYPEADEYAAFMATAERHGFDWGGWPLDRGAPAPVSDEEATDRRYHLFVQWQADAQLRALADKAEAHGLTWYVDFTVGVDPRSYDVWRRPEVFSLRASVGCPPDEGFTTGQNWGFPPLHPDRQREDGYTYLIEALRNHFRYAKAVRLDHVMGLHRLYWIPRDEKSLGTYVTYPADELYAILSVESHRRGAWVVGENLGTVPPDVPGAMHRHALRGLAVLQHALSVADGGPPDVPEAEAVASVNTHDMPTFASYWAGTDIAERVDLGLLNREVAAQEEANRPAIRRALLDLLRGAGLLDASDPPDPSAVYRASAEWLADSPSRMLVLNIEDLWGESLAQNVPGTIEQRPNWRRRLRYPFEEIATMPGVLDLLARVDARRRGPIDAPRA